jgi:hypothetical protein
VQILQRDNLTEHSNKRYVEHASWP